MTAAFPVACGDVGLAVQELRELRSEDPSYTTPRDVSRVDPETGLYYYRARYYSPALGRFLQTDPIGTKDDLNLYAYVKNDPLNATDPSGEDCVSADNTTTCTPNDARFEPFSFETPEDWTDFESEDMSYHEYLNEEPAGQGDEGYKARLDQELRESPTPGEGAASPEGTLIDVDILGPFGTDDVESFALTTSDGDPYIANVTQENHTLHSGFVVRQVMPDGKGGYQIVTYGEGNAWKQLAPGAKAMADKLWGANSREIVGRAR